MGLFAFFPQWVLGSLYLEGAYSYSSQVIETGHGGAIHDAQLDYYGKLLATGSSDNTVPLYSLKRILDYLDVHLVQERITS